MTMEIDTKEFEVLKDAEEVVSLAKKVGRRLKPPNPDSDPKTVVAWRWFVVVGLAVNTLVLVINMLLEWGVLSTVFPGFAYASEQHLAQTQIVAVRIEQLEWRIFDLRVKQCEAINRHESAQVFTVQLDELIKRYREITQRRPDLPECPEVE